jgi:hypothetical protein
VSEGIFPPELLYRAAVERDSIVNFLRELPVIDESDFYEAHGEVGFTTHDLGVVVGLDGVLAAGELGQHCAAG